MTSETESIARGKRIPNWTIQDAEGDSHVLWDYRQKSHLLLIYDPEHTPETRQRWLTAVAADKKQWDWLNVKILFVKKAPKDMVPGAYAIDRYGMLLNSYAPGKWNFNDIEKEFLYYEAFHC